MDILKLSSFHFSWTLNSRFECPGRRYIFHEFNPYILYQESWLSNNILNHVVCFIGKCSMCWHIPLLLLLIQAMMVFFCSCNCELAASRSFCTLLHTTHCCDDLLPTRWQLGIPTSTILWLGVPHHLQKESRYTWLWKVISLQHYIPLKGRNKESELSLC